MISKMVRVTLYGPRTLLSETTALLQSLGIMHIDQASPDLRMGYYPLEKDRAEAASLIELETLLERLKKILLLVPPPAEHTPLEPPPREFSPTDKDLSALLEELLQRAEGMHRQLQEVREEFDLLTKYERVIEGLAPLLEGIESSPYLDMVGVTFERGGSDILPLLRQALTSGIHGGGLER